MKVPTYPTVEQVVALPELERLKVPEDAIDANGHMTVTSYLDVAGRAVAARISQVGIGTFLDMVDGCTVFTAEHHLTYLAELHLGTDISVHTRLLARSAKAIHAMSFIANRDDDRLALILEMTVLHVDLQSRRTHPFPDAALPRLDEAIARDAALPWKPPHAGPMGIR
jgi:acyl-CoA thioester hydrolase